MNYKQADREYRRVGAAHATGDAYRAMCAKTLEFAHGGKAERYYAALPANDDTAVRTAMNKAMADRSYAWDLLMGLA